MTNPDIQSVELTKAYRLLNHTNCTGFRSR